MRNRRDRRNSNGMVVHITNRTVRGLPFPPKYYMNRLLRGVLARGQNLYRVQICHFQWMGNHYHMILTGRGAAISSFIGYIQGEIAKYLRRITKHYQLKVWVGRFKEQRLTTAETVIKKIAYIYNNPVRAGLVARAPDWPGVSSLGMYLSCSLTFSERWIPSRHIKKAGDIDRLKVKDFAAFHRKYALKERHYFKLSPDVWKKSFRESRNWSADTILEKILKQLSQLEEQQAAVRKEKKSSVKGTARLKRQSIHDRYTSKSFSRTPFIESVCSVVRTEAIKSYRAFCEQCREAWEDLKNKVPDPCPFPAGAYRPGSPFITT